MNDLHPDKANYCSYLLRLWQTTRQGNTTWFAMLEDPRTGERHSFTSLEELFSFVEDKLAGSQKGAASQEWNEVKWR